MKIKTIFNIATKAKDEHGNNIAPSKDVIVMQNIEVTEDTSNSQDEENIKEFEKVIRAYNGVLAVNENFEAFYIPPYDGIAETIRHKLRGDKFVIIDLNKVDDNAFITANRVAE